MNLINKALAAAENDELAADWRKEPAQYATVIRELVARVAELEQDAARYRLRLETIRALYPSAPSDIELDAAIDAAIAAQAKQGEQANG